MSSSPVQADPVRVTEQLLGSHQAHPESADPIRTAALWNVDRFPRSAAYDPAWYYANHMGPNVLWLTEALTEVMDLHPGMRVLDLGCGTALSSIFMAKEFGVHVTAADLWVSVSDNWSRINDAGFGRLVMPVHAEAHALPFAHGYFDAMVSLDAYHYFGTDERYLAYLTAFVNDGGQLGVVVPGNSSDPQDPPDGLMNLLPMAAFSDFFTFRSAQWWRRLWTRSGLVTVDVADVISDSWALWHRCMEFDAAWEGTAVDDQNDTALLESELGATLTFTRMVARSTLAERGR